MSERIDPPSDSDEPFVQVVGDGKTTLADLNDMGPAVEPPIDSEQLGYLEAIGLLYDAWCVIANAPDGWTADTEWRQAAIRWRDAWHEWAEG